MQELPSWPKAPQSPSQAFCAAMLLQTCLVTDNKKKGAIDSFQKMQLNCVVWLPSRKL